MENKITKVSNGIVMPLVTPEQAVQAFDSYQKLAEKIMTKEDVQKIGDREFKKKSFWRKCQRFFNLSIELSKEWKEENADKSYTYFVIYRAIAPNGAFMDGDGACTNNEKGRMRTEHDTRSTAHTRAKNRAISDLVAFGEVSAEEVDGHEELKPLPFKEALMTDFQMNRIINAGKKAEISIKELDNYIHDQIDEDWPDKAKITVSKANKIAEALESHATDVLEGKITSEDVDPDSVNV